MQTFVISLKPPTHASNVALRDRLTRHGFSVEVVPGVDGREQKASDYFRQFQHYWREKGKILTPAEMGVSLSHSVVHRLIVERALPYAVVFEDDAQLDDDSCLLLRHLIDARAYERGLVLLGAQEGLEHLTRMAHATAVPDGPGLWVINPDDLGFIYRAAGYVVSGEDAAALAKLAELGPALADDFAYMHANAPLPDVLICDCIGHPLVLEASSVEAERNLLRANALRLDNSLYARLKREIMSTLASRAQERQRRARAVGQARLEWKSRWGKQ